MCTLARSLYFARVVSRMPPLSYAERSTDRVKQRQHFARTKALLCLSNTPVGPWAAQTLEKGVSAKPQSDTLYLLNHLDELLKVIIM